jgi:hypothetical protein
MFFVSRCSCFLAAHIHTHTIYNFLAYTYITVKGGGEQEGKLLSGDQVVLGRQKPAHYQEYCSSICGGCIQCLASSV